MTLFQIILMQLSMKSGICKYKLEGQAAVTKEFLQLHIQEAFEPLIAEDMWEGGERAR